MTDLQRITLYIIHRAYLAGSDNPWDSPDADKRNDVSRAIGNIVQGRALWRDWEVSGLVHT